LKEEILAIMIRIRIGRERLILKKAPGFVSQDQLHKTCLEMTAQVPELRGEILHEGQSGAFKKSRHRS